MYFSNEYQQLKYTSIYTVLVVGARALCGTNSKMKLPRIIRYMMLFRSADFQKSKMDFEGVDGGVEKIAFVPRTSPSFFGGTTRVHFY